MRAAAADAGDRRRQARLLREADRDQPRRGARASRGSPTTAGVKHGVVQDKLFLPGLQQARRCCATPASSAACSRCAASSATGCSRATGSRRSGRRGTTASEDGGGIILDMVCHWRYVLDNLFGEVESVSCLGATHIPSAVTRTGKTYKATADDAAYATFELEGGVIAQINSSWATRVHRDDLVTFQVDGTHGSAVAGLHRLLDPAARQARRARCGIRTSRRRIDFYDRLAGGAGQRRSTTTASRSSGKMFIRHVVRGRALQVRRCWKAPRACSSPNARCKAGASGAGSTSRRSRC